MLLFKAKDLNINNLSICYLDGLFDTLYASIKVFFNDKKIDYMNESINSFFQEYNLNDSIKDKIVAEFHLDMDEFLNNQEYQNLFSLDVKYDDSSFLLNKVKIKDIYDIDNIIKNQIQIVIFNKFEELAEKLDINLLERLEQKEKSNIKYKI